MTPLLFLDDRPYDTMEEVIGIRGVEGVGSLRDWGVLYNELPLTNEGRVDLDALQRAIKPGAAALRLCRCVFACCRPEPLSPCFIEIWQLTWARRYTSGLHPEVLWLRSTPYPHHQ